MGLFLPGKAVFIQSGSEANKTVVKSKGRVDPVYCSLLIGLLMVIRIINIIFALTELHVFKTY